MQVFTRHIKYTYGEVITVKPLMDWHMGSPQCDKAGIRKYLADSGPNTYFIGVGDLMDLIIASDVKRYKQGVTNIQEEDTVDRQINEVYAILEPYKDHILGLGEGNHEETIVKRCSTHPMKRLCEMLGVPYLGYSFLMKLALSEGGSRGRSVIIYGNHGWGGGTTTEGGSITKYARKLAYISADIFLFGHDHEKNYKNIPYGSHGGSRFLTKDRLLVLGGTFKKNLTDGDATTWEETKGFNIKAIGGWNIHIKPTLHWVTITAEG